MALLIDILARGVVDKNGDPLASGSVYVYEVGTTKSAGIYSDADLSSTLTNPVTLDAAGRAEVYCDQPVRLWITNGVGDFCENIERYGGTQASGTTTTIQTTQLVPVGTMIPFYDFNAGLTFDTDYWAYCDGSTATVASESRTLPDISNRYLVGFGTEASGDIGTAAWATAAVGTAPFEFDNSHTHGPGSLQFQAFNTQQYDLMHGFDTDGTELELLYLSSPYLNPGPTSKYRFTTGFNTNTFYTKSGTGATATGGSATTDFQPRSIRVRWIMRTA